MSIQPTARESQAHKPRGHRAFSLIEVLLVIGIIAILAVIALTVGSRVAGSAKITKTTETLKVLDLALSEYIAAKGGMPPATVVDPEFDASNAGNNLAPIWPIVDGRYEDDSRGTLNSMGLFLVQAKGIAGVDKAIAGLDASLLKEYTPEEEIDPSTKEPKNQGPNDEYQPDGLLTVLDAWGNPIRYVHPAWHGLVREPGPGAYDPNSFQDVTKILADAPAGKKYAVMDIRRNNQASGGKADSDGGLTKGGRPYFYSAGPDGDPSTIDDNVYLVQPQIMKNNS
jgi:prepilin-type N-terminal cleavage/methylation domain-containing protein